MAFVVADTLERAREAAHLIAIKYDTQTPLLEAQQVTYEPLPDIELRRGDVSAGMTETVATVEATYTTSKELHSAMEPHAIVAHWQGGSLTVYEGSQWVMLHQRTYAELFGIPSEKVRLVTPYIGGAFGSKCFPWSYSVLCAAIARQINRPLKLS